VCLVIFAVNQVPGYPLILGANRDEFYKRPTGGPRILIDQPRALGGVDELAGGTWLAISTGRYCVGLTNFRSEDVPVDVESRGQLVLDLARAGEASAAAQLLEGIDPGRYAGFNAFVASTSGVTVGYSRPKERVVEMESHGSGVHVLSNHRNQSKLQRAAELARDLGSTFEQAKTVLTHALSDHHRPEMALPDSAGIPEEIAAEVAAICVHTPVYGTRSSTIVAVPEGKGDIRYLQSDGPPCATGFDDFGWLLRS
jgi:uncharacterized protein with NRDE domain